MVIDALSAVGSVGAAAIALYIATSDRRERSKELGAADEAQAKLVILTQGARRDNPEDWVTYRVHYHNHGSQPILDIRLVAAQMRSEPGSVARIPEWTKPVVAAGDHATTASAEFFDSGGEQLPRKLSARSSRYSPEWPDTDSLDIRSWIEFYDANGNRWAKSTDGVLRRIKSDSELHRLIHEQ